MSLASLERAIVGEARDVLRNPRFRNKDLIAWQTGLESEPPPNYANADLGEVAVWLPLHAVWVCVPVGTDKRQ